MCCHIRQPNRLYFYEESKFPLKTKILTACIIRYERWLMRGSCRWIRYINNNGANMMTKPLLWKKIECRLLANMNFAWGATAKDFLKWNWRKRIIGIPTQRSGHKTSRITTYMQSISWSYPLLNINGVSLCHLNLRLHQWLSIFQMRIWFLYAPYLQATCGTCKLTWTRVLMLLIGWCFKIDIKVTIQAQVLKIL